jgi:hypothetical protein
MRDLNASLFEEIMARIRSVHPGLATDEAFMALTVECPVAIALLLGLWSESDDHGIFEWKPLTLKARSVPAITTPIDELLACLERHRFIKKFELNGKSYGAVRNFMRFQRPKKPNYTHPVTDEVLLYVGTGDAPCDDNSEPVPNQFPTSGEKSPQMKEEGEGRRKKEERETPPQPPANSEEPVRKIGGVGGLGLIEPEPEAKDFVQVIQAFDRERVLAFGEAQGRPWPHPNDRGDAQRFLAAGADLQLCREVFRAACQKLAGQSEQPPGSLKFFEKRIADAIASRDRPMPAGHARTPDFDPAAYIRSRSQQA